MFNCFENSADLVEFFNLYETEITDKYNLLSKNAVSGMQYKSCIYFAVKEAIIEKGRFATECQINKLVNLIMYKTT